MKSVKQIKTENARALESALEARVAELLARPDLDSLKREIEEFETDPYDESANFICFDEWGEFVSRREIDLPDCLSDEELETLEALLGELVEFGSFRRTPGSSDPLNWELSQFLGDPVMINPDADRLTLAVYSRDLRLEIDSVVDLEHGLMIVERAQRRAGVFENIILINYNGDFVKFLSTGELAKLSDTELMELIEVKESQNEND